MQIKLDKMDYIVNGKNGSINFKSKNVITGENDFGKSFLISLLLTSLGSRSEKERMIDLVKEKHSFECWSCLKYDIIGSGYKSDGEIKNIEVTFKYLKNDRKPSYTMKINNVSRVVTGTTSYAKEIFNIIGMPRRIVWEKSLTTLFMDDLLRFTTLMQDNINNVNEYSKILPLYKAPKIRVAIVMLFFLNPRHKLIRDLIDNENLFREVELSTIIGDLKNSVVKRSMNFNGEDKTRLQDLSKQINGWRVSNTEKRKIITSIDKELLFISLSKKTEKTSQQIGILSYLEELRKNNLVPSNVNDWIEENINVLKMDYFNELDDKEEALKEKRRKYVKESKDLTESINKYTDDLNDEEIAYVLNEVVNGLPVKKAEINPKIEEMKKMYSNIYPTILKNFSSIFLGGDKPIRWNRFGGATQLIKNVNRVVKLNQKLFDNKQRIMLPTIIDGILAEDFGKSNEKADWVKNSINASNQLIIAYSNGDSSNKGVHDNTNRIISENKDKIGIHKLKKSLF